MHQDNPVDQIIVIGASSGGLMALRTLLAQLPSDLQAAVFITMHIGDQPSLLPSLLAKASSLDIDFALSGETPKNGRVYVAPPDQHLLIKRGSLQLVRGAKENYSRPAIDPMFRSAAISYAEGAIGVILTGELDDGVVGLQAIKAYGGRVYVQDPETAEAPSMPMNALRHVEVDACLPLDELGSALGRLVQQRAPQAHAPGEPKRIEPYATENDLTEDLSSGGAYALDAIGKVSGVSCPECGGSLWELGAAPPRFRCHTGHSYTSAALFHGQNGVIEEALWVAIRAMHEKQLLLGRQIQSSKAVGRTGAVKEYELASEGLEGHKDTLRALVTTLRPVSSSRAETPK
ncbi:two-component system, chemotaxis family, response regulator CheB [Pseudomonas cedrina]|uniref:protein-glutamate methylesterase n=2 Tax=Pseudomonas cedrina TaxID=651740 RepID=A0A1V2K256_PSECE|nr:chemotaxis protein CheB [Pseudomonas cedrina]ONH51186.1 chemotaxis protein [Pseudomonas cedrina subsp. cedrina]SDS79044.1 two-component system, chemotaxis family, response regulator CheB [Pseudomonas cedrina]